MKLSKDGIGMGGDMRDGLGPTIRKGNNESDPRNSNALAAPRSFPNPLKAKIKSPCHFLEALTNHTPH